LAREHRMRSSLSSHDSSPPLKIKACRHSGKLLLALQLCLAAVGALWATDAIADKDQVWVAQLSDGRQYQIHHRIVQVPDHNDVFLVVNAYYVPGSGEFLWRGDAYTKDGYLKYLAAAPKNACAPSSDHIVQLLNGEWTEFYGSNGNL